MELIIAFCVLSVFLAVCLFLVKWYTLVRFTSQVPTLSGGLPLIGHALKLQQSPTLMQQHIIEYSDETNKKGGVSKLWLGPFPVYVITDPDDAKTVSNASFKKSYIYGFTSAWIGEGLFTGPPEKWMKHRKLINPVFNLQILNDFMEVFNNHAANLVEMLASKVDVGSFEHAQVLEDFALDLICYTTFGLSNNKITIDKGYKNAVTDIFDVILTRFTNIWMHLGFLYNRTMTKREQDKIVKTLHKTSTDILQKHHIAAESKDHYNLSDSKHKAFLELIMTLLKNGTFSQDEAREELDSMIVGGYETTATSLVFTFWLLGSHPDVQEKVYDEIKEIYGNSDRNVSKEDIPNLIYTEAVIKESLRLYPVAPVVIRVMENDVLLKNCTIASGTNTAISIWGINRCKDWGDNAEVFNPDRWLNSSSLPTNPSAYASFSLGRRNCIGKTYAMLSIKSTLVHVLRRYRLMADPSPIKLQFRAILKPATPCKISIQLR